MKKNNLKAWLYLLPAILFLGVFMVYPLIDVCFYSLEENYQSIAQTYTGVGLGNFFPGNGFYVKQVMADSAKKGCQ